MRMSLPVGAVLCAAAGLVAACGTESPIVDSTALVEDLREYVPSVASYPDDTLLSIAENVCRIGRDDGTRILDNYSELDEEDYASLVTVVFGVNGCPNDEDN